MAEITTWVNYVHNSSKWKRPSFDSLVAVELFNEELSLAQMVKMRKKFYFTGQICTASRALTFGEEARANSSNIFLTFTENFRFSQPTARNPVKQGLLTCRVFRKVHPTLGSEFLTA